MILPVVLSLLVTSVQPGSLCQEPMDRGNGSEVIERFYFDNDLLCCFSFKYSGSGGNSNNYATLRECKRCMPEDAGHCDRIRGEKYADIKEHKELATDVECGQSIENPATTFFCPIGFLCQIGMHDFQCRDENAQRMVDQGYSRMCPDGTEARATHGKNCTEMFCADDENCQQVNDFFATCCKNKK